MSKIGYTPRADSAAARVIGWLRLNPQTEAIGLDEISSECDAVRGNIHTLLREATEAGLLTRFKDDEGEYHYKRGPEFRFFAGGSTALADALRPTVHTATRRQTPVANATPVDLATLPIDDDVPLTRGGSSLQDFAVLLRRMEKPGQSAALPARLRSQVTKAIQQWHKDQPKGKFCVRKTNADTIRVHRVA